MAAVRDRRFDHLYDLRKQPVRDHVLAHFADELATELRGWPPAAVEWTSEADRARWGAGAAAAPREAVLRLALEVARLDLAREFEAVEAYLERERHRLQPPAEEAAVHLLVRLVTERCLGLKEHADRLRLTRDDLVAAVAEVERRLFRVTPA